MKRINEIDFIFQLSNLRIKRSGWLSVGIRDCESVAEHSFRTAFIAYIIAIHEGLTKEMAKDALMLALLHDVHETRIGDLNALAKKYMKVDEEMAKKESLSIFEKNIIQNEKLAKIVKDADLLEMFFQAKEYADEGNRYAEKWFAPEKLKTQTARKIYEKMRKRDSRAWLLGAVKW